ncbi:hypothetical protein Tco_0500312 [Tanacetum coccineum]
MGSIKKPDTTIKVSRSQRISANGSQFNHNITTNDKNPKPNPSSYPNNIPLKNKDKFPDLLSFASVTNGIAKPTVDTSSTNANIRALVLDDQDLINVEDPSMVLLVKLKDMNSMSNMYVICRNEDVNGMEKVEDSVDENSLADLNDLNDMKETINELASNEIQHPIIKENMEQEDDIKKVSPEITVSSDLSLSLGFEHMKRTCSKCSTSFAKYRKKDIKGVSLIEELSGIIKVGDPLVVVRRNGENVFGLKTYASSITLGIQEYQMTCLETFRLKYMWDNYNFDFACSMARGRSGGMISMWDPNSFIKDDRWCDDAFIIVKGHWRNTVGDCYIINIYGPQDFLAKAILWNRIGDFMHQYAEEVVKALPNVHVTVIDRLWSDHNLILLHFSKSDFGLIPFKFFHSWLLCDSFDKVIKTELPKLEEHNFERKLLSHEKFCLLKAKIKQWHYENKTSDRVTKHDNLQLIKSIEEKIEVGFANDDDRDSRIKLLQEVDRLDTFETFDLFQKAQKFKNHDSNVVFPLFANSSGLCSLDRDSLETPVSLDEVKKVACDCGSSKAPGPDGFSFAFVKKYLDYIKVDILEYVNTFIDTSSLPHGSNSSFFTLIPKILFFLILASALNVVLGLELVSPYLGLRFSSMVILPRNFISNVASGKEILSTAVSSGFIRGVKFGSPELTISHLFYVDDVIITTEWNANDLDNIIRVYSSST